jgi:hypothetical protein
MTIATSEGEPQHLEQGRRAAIMKELQDECATHLIPGPCAARDQDFLYDEDGLPA